MVRFISSLVLTAWFYAPVAALAQAANQPFKVSIEKRRVVGHVIAVYLAHAEALAFFGDRNKALMAGYTMISLWIIAQPVVI